jgi:hypothetical protein
VRPQTTALLDQADAANHEAARIMACLAQLESTTVRNVTPGPVHRALISRMHARALSGQLTLCPDLSYDAPSPAFWVVWAPGRLRCASCAETASRRIHGTAEDRRCDHCRKTGPKIHPDLAQLPPVVVDMPPFPPKCVPPITLIFGLCPACQTADQDVGAPPPPNHRTRP